MEGLPRRGAARGGQGWPRRPRRSVRAGRAGSGLLSPAGRRVVVWRHGQTAWNLAGRFQGQTDVDLDEVGLAQAVGAAARLATLCPDAVVTSDLRRAAGTAAALAALVDAPVAVDARLRESHGGVWQGLTTEEIRARYAGDFDAWLHGADVTAGGGESRAQVAVRARAAVLAAVRDVPAGGTLVAVTHGGTARAAIGSLLGLPQACWTSLGPLSNCCWSVLEELGEPYGEWRLLEHNAGSLPEPVLGDER